MIENYSLTLVPCRIENSSLRHQRLIRRNYIHQSHPKYESYNIPVKHLKTAIFFHCSGEGGIDPSSSIGLSACAAFLVPFARKIPIGRSFWRTRLRFERAAIGNHSYPVDSHYMTRWATFAPPELHQPFVYPEPDLYVEYGDTHQESKGEVLTV